MYSQIKNLWKKWVNTCLIYKLLGGGGPLHDVRKRKFSAKPLELETWEHLCVDNSQCSDVSRTSLSPVKVWKLSHSAKTEKLKFSFIFYCFVQCLILTILWPTLHCFSHSDIKCSARRSVLWHLDRITVILFKLFQIFYKYNQNTQK